jgi:hypothetical protein
MWQTLIVALVVIVCALSAGWQLMPKALRNRVLRSLQKRVPAQWAISLALLNTTQSGCGSCGGCSKADGAPAVVPETQRIFIVRSIPAATKQ